MDGLKTLSELCEDTELTKPNIVRCSFKLAAGGTSYSKLISILLVMFDGAPNHTTHLDVMSGENSLLD